MAKIKPKTLGKVTQLRLTQPQYDELRSGGLTTFARILATVRTTTGVPIAHVTDREINGLRTATSFPGGGGWQNWARAVLQLNGLQ